MGFIRVEVRSRAIGLRLGGRGRGADRPGMYAGGVLLQGCRRGEVQGLGAGGWVIRPKVLQGKGIEAIKKLFSVI